ncbi:hypothetical protein SAMD00023353_3900560 [Rosellinia necatrix]|uniref:AB hydrolase-1 domain-containing protein n=1 Tax=Rosellinia necatrix TaxID=77044 RepID=A0A1S7UNK3_ROSNE|nr:hypothetical protein SAMD00023353_3900560 [Rosellinia necatrix]
MAPIIVICSGGWPLASFFTPLVGAFQGRQYVAVCKPPEDYASIPSDSNLNPDVSYLRDQVLSPLLEQGHDIAIFMHSYGGVYGPEAVEGLSKKERSAQGLQGGVVALIFNAAFVAPRGVSAIDAMGMDPNDLPEYLDHDRSTGLVAFKKDYAKAMLFHDLPDEEADRLAESLPKQPFACFITPVSWDPYGDPNFKGLMAYIHTGADRIVPLELQKKFVKTAGINLLYMMENSSHSPHHEQPEVLAGVVIDLLNQIIAGTEG